MAMAPGSVEETDRRRHDPESTSQREGFVGDKVWPEQREDAFANPVNW